MSLFHEKGHEVVRYHIADRRAFVRCENHTSAGKDNYALGLASVPVGVWKVCPLCHGEVFVSVRGEINTTGSADVPDPPSERGNDG